MSSQAAERGARADARVTAGRETGHTALGRSKPRPQMRAPRHVMGHQGRDAPHVANPGLARQESLISEVSDFPPWTGGDELITGTFSPAAAATV